MNVHSKYHNLVSRKGLLFGIPIDSKTYVFKQSGNSFICEGYVVRKTRYLPVLNTEPRGLVGKMFSRGEIKSRIEDNFVVYPKNSWEQTFINRLISGEINDEDYSKLLDRLSAEVYLPYKSKDWAEMCDEEDIRLNRYSTI